MSAGPQRDWSDRRLHFIGVGGAGMSGLALVCSELGAEVSGSDRADSSYMGRLRDAGLDVVVGHEAGGTPSGADVVVSTAIAEDNPELAAARRAGARVIRRGELLAQLCAGKRLIAVAGTHGKTTTTAMAAWALRAAGAEPAFFVGGEVPGLGPEGGTANAGWGAGDWAVAEADESDASFLELRPEVAVVTNLEMDHHSRWGSVAELRRAFARFAAGARAVVVPAGGGLEGLADDGAELIEFDESSPGPVELALSAPGRHNRLNARAALAGTGAALGDPAAAASLAAFPGVRRRLELRGERDGASVYDDYGHHPTEVAAALSALREAGAERLVAVFQPHLFSRTRAFAEQFGKALSVADEVAVLDVYPAREEPLGELAGVSGLDVARAASDRMQGRPVLWTPTIEAAVGALERRLRPGVMVVTIGAGDVFRVAEALVDGGGR